MKKSRYGEAVLALEQGLTLDPNNKDLLEQLVSCNIELKKPSSALQALDRLTRIEPGALTAWAHKGFLHLLLNQNQEGIKAITTGLLIDSKNSWLWQLLGMAYMSEERWDLALESLERSLLLDPNSAATWYNCAVCHFFLDDYDSSVQAADQAVAIDPMLSELTDEWTEGLREAAHIFRNAHDDDYMSAS